MNAMGNENCIFVLGIKHERTSNNNFKLTNFKFNSISKFLNDKGENSFNHLFI